MQNRDVHFLWQTPQIARKFGTGVCLHGHTMYSKECLDFLPRYLKQAPVVSQIVAGYEKPKSGSGTDFARAYWTPPLPPQAAARLEHDQIARLGLTPLISLTDHDSIDACVALHLAGGWQSAPISVEWTVPYEKAILHIGVHNLPPDGARERMAEMAAFTESPDDTKLPELLEALARIPQVLIVLNHPFWLEEGVVETDRSRAVERLRRDCRASVHALELNGTRSWPENFATIALAETWGRPVVSGGDRHGCEPAACVNLTNAASFSEFAAEVRDGHGNVCFMPHYRESMASRILEASWDILRPYPEYAGRERYTDRIFYTGADGETRALSTIWKDGVPWTLRAVTNAVELFATTGLRSAIRVLSMRREEILL